MKKILGLALAGAFLVACGSQNKQSTGMQHTTAANQEPAPTEANPAQSESAPAATNPPSTEMNSAPTTATPDSTQTPPPNSPQ